MCTSFILWILFYSNLCLKNWLLVLWKTTKTKHSHARTHMYTYINSTIHRFNDEYNEFSLFIAYFCEYEWLQAPFVMDKLNVLHLCLYVLYEYGYRFSLLALYMCVLCIANAFHYYSVLAFYLFYIGWCVSNEFSLHTFLFSTVFIFYFLVSCKCIVKYICMCMCMWVCASLFFCGVNVFLPCYCSW